MRYPEIMKVPGLRGPLGLTIEQIATLAGLNPETARTKIAHLIQDEALVHVPDTKPSRYKIRITGRNLLTMPWRSPDVAA